MIKIEKTQVLNLDGAIRGMRNPMNSWDKSDSEVDIIAGCQCFVVGENDLDLMKKLIKAGSDHRKFMRQIFVCVDITAPLYWWKEFDTYKVGTVSNSCSTMHKIHSKEFKSDDFSCEHLFNSLGQGMYRENLLYTIGALNHARKLYLETKDKKYWWQMIQLLPSSYNQKRTITLTYENLINMYHARKNHKLDEWKHFCGWVETLPYAKDLICEKGKEND